jgi:hypothetical protein
LLCHLFYLNSWLPFFSPFHTVLEVKAVTSLLFFCPFIFFLCITFPSRLLVHPIIILPIS